jgi:hypothetical protein
LSHVLQKALAAIKKDAKKTLPGGACTLTLGVLDKSTGILRTFSIGNSKILVFRHGQSVFTSESISPLDSPEALRIESKTSSTKIASVHIERHFQLAAGDIVLTATTTIFGALFQSEIGLLLQNPDFTKICQKILAAGSNQTLSPHLLTELTDALSHKANEILSVALSHSKSPYQITPRNLLPQDPEFSLPMASRNSQSAMILAIVLPEAVV